MDNFMVRASSVIIETMDAEVASGQYASRSDYARVAIQYYQNRKEFQKDLGGTVEKLVLEGRLDMVLEERMRLIWQRIATERSP